MKLETLEDLGEFCKNCADKLETILLKCERCQSTYKIELRELIIKWIKIIRFPELRDELNVRGEDDWSETPADEVLKHIFCIKDEEI